MNPDTALGLFGLDDSQPPSGAGDGDTAHALRVLTRVIGIVALDVGVMTSLVGLALLLTLLAPRRLQGGLARLSDAPVRGYLLGLAAFLALGAVGVLLFHLHIRPGRGLVGLLAVLGLSSGYAVCARALGERALPGGPPLAQTLVGLMALVLPLATPAGIPVLLVAAPLGFGAWLAGPRRSVAV
jgi:hypothetical protein